MGEMMDRRSFLAASVASATTGGFCLRASADEPASGEESTGLLNIALPTQGGKQFWADEYFFHDWHIQRNVITQHCRLIDGNNVRHAWGSFEECRNKLHQIAEHKQMPAMQGSAVILLHGLFRSAGSMSGMADFLHQQGGYSVFCISYPSTRGSIADHAQGLHRVLQSLHGIEEIFVVAHSLGNIVTRHYLADQTRPRDGVQPDSRLRGMVMLAPPNQGSELARSMSHNYLFRSVAGKAAVHLGADLSTQGNILATPTFPFGIIAGGHGEKGYNPLLQEDDDMVVTVESTRLAGAADFAVLPLTHTFIMDDPVAQQYTLQFFKNGYFQSPEKRQPIVDEG